MEFVDKESAFPDNSFLKPNIDAVYFVTSLETKIPVIYFKEMKSVDEDRIIDLHRKIWNEGSVPFLILILPTEIRVYNTFVPTQKDKSEFNENALVKTLTLYQKAHENINLIKRELTEFSRHEVETGEFWKKESLKFGKAKKIDTYLLSNLKMLRHRLSKESIPFDIINKLIVNSIFVSYMQDREILTKEYFSQINNDCSNFSDILESKEDTFALFNRIYLDFNGDAFDVSQKEKGKIKRQHLELIKLFLLGAEFDKKTDAIQMSLFPYCFDVIPIELISSIYEEFLKDDNTTTVGNHYTPHHLVALSLDFFYKNNTLLGKKIVDPACGSGVFLVDTYRRIVEEWYTENKETPNWAVLERLILDHIYGVDINEDAIRVAIFSLYLKMLDYLPVGTRESVELPCLYNQNLFHADFFSKDFRVNNMQFNYFIGNPPWDSLKADSIPVQFCNDNEYPISDNQIAQAFIWKIHKLASSHSKACLVLPAKSVLFNKSETNKEFRNQFLDKHNVELIINISTLRKGLFHNAVGPAIIAIYSFDKESENILYISPKSSSENNNSSYIIINSVDMTTIPRKQFTSNENVWKIAMWGSSIDSEIIKKIADNVKLKDIIPEDNMGEGFVIGKNGKKVVPELKHMPCAKPRKIERYYYNPKLAKRVGTDRFRRATSKPVFKAPHLLIRKNKLIAAYLDEDMAFTHAVLGIHIEDKPLLKYISSLINSPLMKYYFFLTASAWGVERDNIHTMEIKSMPVVIPQTSDLSVVVKLYDNIQSKLKRGGDATGDIEKLNNLVYDIYSMTNIERMIIKDTLNFSLSIFEKGDKSIAYKKINKRVIEDYVKTVSTHVNGLLNYSNSFLNGKVYFSGSPLNLVVFSIDSNLKPVDFFEESTQMELILKDIEELLGEDYTRKISLNKNLRLYQKDRIILIKFNERRLWSEKQAIIDGNRLISEIITGG